MLTVDEISEYYKKFDDSKILEIASNPRGLRREVVEILHQELKRRGLDVGLIAWVKQETNYFSEAESTILKNRISQLVCPNCKQNSNLNGYKYYKIVSFILYNKDEIWTEITCKSCAFKKMRKNFLWTFLFGWWSKSGILTTPIYLFYIVINLLYLNRINKEVFDLFIAENTGLLRSSNDDFFLSELITEYNKTQNGEEVIYDKD
jgi:hypothetical protein